MKAEKSNAADKETVLIQIAIGNDHINRLKEFRARYWAANEDLAIVAREILEEALANREPFLKIMDATSSKAKRQDLTRDQYVAKLLHCPKGHRVPYYKRLKRAQKAQEDRPLTDEERAYCEAEAIPLAEFAARKMK